MDNSKNMEPGIRNIAVQDSPNKEQRKKREQTRNQREGADHSELTLERPGTTLKSAPPMGMFNRTKLVYS